MPWLRIFLVSLLLSACSGSGTRPTTPPLFPSTAATYTVERIAEIEAIYEDLEQRRIDALYREDRNAYSALFANEGFLEASMVVFDQLDFAMPPVVNVEILDLLNDGGECIAFERVLHRADLGGSSDAGVVVLELVDGVWLMSYVGSGWTCEGPHPFES